MAARSYLSQVALPITFGLGNSDQIGKVIVQWPDGKLESWSDIAVDRTHVLQQGTGQEVSL